MVRFLSRCIAYLGIFLEKTGVLLQGFGGRLGTGGWKSGRVYLKWAATGAWVKLNNRLAGRPRVECPCCGWQGHEFLTIDCGTFTVPAAECPHCHGQERHRMLHLYLERSHPGFFTMEGRVLHFAPERHVRDIIVRNPGLQCVSTDYANYMTKRFPGPAVQTDMQHLGLANNSFELMFCLHVLEHVPDDRLGIAELRRVLKPGGVAYIMVPFMMGWEKTIEFGAPDPDIFDHVRGYSPDDFDSRLAPFNAEKIMPGDFLTAEEVRRYRIPKDSQVIYRCLK